VVASFDPATPKRVALRVTRSRQTDALRELVREDDWDVLPNFWDPGKERNAS